MLLKSVQKESDEIEKRIDKLQRMDKKSQGYILSCSRNKGSYRWHCRKIDEKAGFRLSRKERAKAERYAAETYNRYLLEDCIKEKKALDYYLKFHGLEDGKSEKYLSNPGIQELLAENYRSKDEELNAWEKAEYVRNTDHLEGLTVRSATGIMVRSKSEAIIDMALMQNHIPHRYEDEFVVDEITLRPDFTIRHPKTERYFIWEHFGLLDDSNYCNSSFNKLKLYAKRGFYPSINLIITGETTDHPLDLEYVNVIINHYFL